MFRSLTYIITYIVVFALFFIFLLCANLLYVLIKNELTVEISLLDFERILVISTFVSIIIGTANIFGNFKLTGKIFKNQFQDTLKYTADDLTLEKKLKSIKNFKSIKKANQSWMITTKPNWVSWGEEITIEKIDEQNYLLKSRSLINTTLLDFGQNQRNVEYLKKRIIS
jgi:heme/copper-type cytochrome/quinol oxidase subunit 1